MTGLIIPFQSYRNSEPIAPRGAHRRSNDASRIIRSHTDFGPAGRSTRVLKPQGARIAQLLDELEELAGTSDNFPPAIVRQTHTSMERARRILQPFSGSERDAGREDDDARAAGDGRGLGLAILLSAIFWLMAAFIWALA